MKTPRYVLMAAALALASLAGCITMVAYDQNSVKNVEATIAFEKQDRALTETALKRAAADPVDQNSYAARHDALEERLAMQLRYELGKSPATPTTTAKPEPGKPEAPPATPPAPAPGAPPGGRTP